MENLYTLLSIFKYYLITPIFIFDGKPPPEKWDLIKKRNIEKKEAEEQLIIMSNNPDDYTKEEIDELRKKAVRIKNMDILKAKELIDAFGFIYYDAPGEADKLCAYFVNKGIAWGCLSDDMDMFLYGCKRVIRNLSLMNHCIMFYDTSQILIEIGFSYNEFLEIMILSGTDYNDGYVSLRKIVELYNEYKKTEMVVYETREKFYDWFLKKYNFNESKNFTSIYNIFDISGKIVDLDEFTQRFKNDILEKHTNIVKIKEIMGNYGFLFP